MMKRFLFCLVVLILPMSVFATPAMVDYIVDGDTFSAKVLLEDDIKILVRVRLINIDTPEIHGQCDSEIEMAIRAKDRLAELIPVGSVVELDNIKDDKYLGRIDAYVRTANGSDVGDILIKEKLGRPYSGGRRNPWCK